MQESKLYKNDLEVRLGTRKYGDFFITEAYIGGQILFESEVSSDTSSKNVNSDKSIKIDSTVAADVAGIGGGGVSAHKTNTDSGTTNEGKSSMSDNASLQCIGGEPIQRFTLLNSYCQAISGHNGVDYSNSSNNIKSKSGIDCGLNCKGGMIISQIYKFCRTGNKFEFNFTESVLNCICHPLFDMISKWITVGELYDPFKEFFIVSNDDITLADMC